ncbi:MAG TPA: aromatic amino acid transport family protein [Rhabdochlamydiaceae bacterium]|jgi:tyrosine-specific transport protein|nr:aromatic amino acid transport family protein [Rhabdochlamydiaceae bacterium]
MHIIRNLGHVVGGTLLIAATTIGVGMLGLPVATGPGGFVPATFVYILTWFFMLCTGLLLLEVCTWMPAEANLITMTHRLLGPVGKAVCWVVYLFLFFTAMIAHVSGGGSTLVDILNLSFGIAMPQSVAMVVYVLIFSPVVYMGTRSVDRFNLLMMTGVLITYVLFIVFSAGRVDVDLLKYADWSKAWPALPVLFTAFTYQLIIPTLMTYMDRDVKKVRLSIILGSSIPLVVYLVWELLILGIIPVDTLVQAKARGETAVMPLKELLQNPWVFKIGSCFAFLVLTTSYVALSLAFLDFVADGLKIEKKGIKKIVLCMGIFFPPMIIAMLYPDIFITALEYAGGISCALLFGLLPPVMVWVGRYLKKYEHQNIHLPGGKLVLSALMLFTFVELILQVMNQIHRF